MLVEFVKSCSDLTYDASSMWQRYCAGVDAVVSVLPDAMMLKRSDMRHNSFVVDSHDVSIVIRSQCSVANQSLEGETGNCAV